MDKTEQRSKHAEKMRKWRAANKARVAATRAQWRANNPTKSAEYSRAARERDPESARRRNREWYFRNQEAQRARALDYRNSDVGRARKKSADYNRLNPEKLAVIARNRRARARAGGTHTEGDIAEILKMQKGRCGYCRIAVNMGFHVDHIVPLARGGSNIRSNLQILCEACNKSKSAKDPIVFARSRGMLL